MFGRSGRFAWALCFKICGKCDPENVSRTGQEPETKTSQQPPAPEERASFPDRFLVVFRGAGEPPAPESP